jgi:hypothetical protein
MKGAIKIHTVLDYDSCLPVFIRMTDGKTSDIEIAEKLAFLKGSILAIDRGYLDFNFLRELDSNEVFFVTRAKRHFIFIFWCIAVCLLLISDKLTFSILLTET